MAGQLGFQVIALGADIEEDAGSQLVTAAISSQGRRGHLGCGAIGGGIKFGQGVLRFENVQTNVIDAIGRICEHDHAELLFGIKSHEGMVAARAAVVPHEIGAEFGGDVPA